MPKGRPEPKDRVTTQQDLFIRMLANGCSNEEILKAVFNTTKGAPDEHAAKCKMSRWRKHPLFRQVWEDELAHQDLEIISKARQRLIDQLDSNNEWLVNKAANDLITQGNRRIYGVEENSVKVQISGLPDLGSPDQDDG